MEVIISILLLLSCGTNIFQILRVFVGIFGSSLQGKYLNIFPRCLHQGKYSKNIFQGGYYQIFLQIKTLNI